MKTDAGKRESIWTATADAPPANRLTEDTQANVCIVGAGIAGLTTGYLLACEGKSVVVLDDGPVAGGETSRTTAHLVNVLDDRFFNLERLHGERGSRLAAQSHTAAIAKIEEIAAAEGIGCEFERVDGYLINSPGQPAEILEMELEAAKRAGIEPRLVDRAPIQGFDTGRCLRFPRQAQFHPLRYLYGLAKAIEREGGRIFTHTHAEKVEGGEHASVTVRGGLKVLAKAVVVATNTPINDMVVIHTKQAPYRTYVIGALIPRGSVPRILVWDTADPYHYVRVQSLSEKHDVLIVGGEDHKTGQEENTDARFDRLEDWARVRFPQIEWVEFRWSGQVMEPVDSLAFIGHNPLDEKNVYIATGDSGNGMTHGTIAGMLLTDLIQHRDNEWEKLYDPRRKTMRAAGEFARENLNVAKQYVADFVSGGDAQSADDVAPGQGALIRRGLQKIAVYRDEAGEVHEFSAVCPHLHCIVHWNSTESTWDCPCHGSRFDPLGKVINGPAISDLRAADDDEPREGAPVPAAVDHA